MKNIIFFLILISIILYSFSFAYSEKFDFMIDVMNISLQNKSGKMLNEEIYNKYSLFVYGSPLDGFTGQRFKEVEEGRWTKNSGAWNGEGIRGEYWILGENEEGYEVHNHKFPVDIEPPTPPTRWKYAYLNDAISSWQDQSKYMDEEQKDYMLNTKLMRNDITYDLTANSIGLDKIKLENYATWKTKGTLYTERYDMNGKRWSANFMVLPLAGDADVSSFADFPNGEIYYFNKEEKELPVLINYGAEAINLTDFAKAEHVKQIKSELYINDILISSIEDVGKLQVQDSHNYIVQNNGEDIVVLNVKIKSSLITKFIPDGALVDIKDYTIFIYSDPFIEKSGDDIINELTEEDNTTFNYVSDEEYARFKEIPPPYIEEIIINGNNGSSLPTIKKTGKKFVCAGQTIEITAKVVNYAERVWLEIEGNSSITTFDDVTKKIEWEEPRSRKQTTFLSSLNDYKEMYSGTVSLKKVSQNEDYATYKGYYIVPYKTKQTLHSWATLREQSKDAFNINESRLFERISSPYNLVVKVKSYAGADTKRAELDVFERWDTLYNRDLSSYVLGGNFNN